MSVQIRWCKFPFLRSLGEFNFDCEPVLPSHLQLHVLSMWVGKRKALCYGCNCQSNQSIKTLFFLFRGIKRLWNFWVNIKNFWDLKKKAKNLYQSTLSCSFWPKLAYLSISGPLAFPVTMCSDFCFSCQVICLFLKFILWLKWTLLTISLLLLPFSKHCFN